MNALYKLTDATSYDLELTMKVQVTPADLVLMRTWLAEQRLAVPERDDLLVAQYILYALQIRSNLTGARADLAITSCKRSPLVYMLPLGIDGIARVIVAALLVAGGAYALVRIGHAIAQLT
jgi:hypothetical protein